MDYPGHPSGSLLIKSSCPVNRDVLFLTAMIKRKQELEVTIERVAYGGKGIAHVNDFVIFVENSIPGDRVRVKIKKSHTNYGEAFPLELLEPSPDRINAPCRHFGYCGGCKWQNLPYMKQLEYKKSIVAESLAHIAGIPFAAVRETLPAPLEFGYRNKMEFSFTENRWLPPEDLLNPEIQKDFGLGFHVPRSFFHIMDIEECLLQSDLLNDILSFSKEFFRNAGVSVFHPRKHTGVLRYLVLRQSSHFREVMVNVVTSEEMPEVLAPFAKELQQKFPAVVSVINNVNRRLAQVAVGDDEFLLAGKPFIREKLGSYVFEISANSFFQTNSLQAEHLYRVVKEFASPRDGVVWDLYCGAGSISLFLSAEAREVYGFELAESAVRDARNNAERNAVTNCKFISGDLRRQILNFRSLPAPDVLICDPPRSGMHKDVVNAILRINPAVIVYVSCNPATMARDIEILAQNYEIKECQPVDMFPHTYHIETVVKLARR